MTDETAKAILAFDKDELFYYDPPSVAQEQNGVSGFSPLLGVDVTDLRQMARLWLMKRELTSALHFIIDTTPDGSTVKNNATEWLAKITAIAEEE